MGIKHLATKISGDKGLASEWNDDHIIDGNVDFNKKQANKLVIDGGTSFPASPVEGQLFYRSDLKKCYQYNDTAWSLLTTGTNYWGCSGSNFDCNDSSIETLRDEGMCIPQSGTNIWVTAPVFGIPNGAVITGAIVYGDPTGATWYLRRITLSTSSMTGMASATINNEDTTISNATIDSSTYGYFFEMIGVDGGDSIFGARITYTL